MGGDEFPNAAKSILIFRNPHLNLLALAPYGVSLGQGSPRGFGGPLIRLIDCGRYWGAFMLGNCYLSKAVVMVSSNLVWGT